MHEYDIKEDVWCDTKAKKHFVHRSYYNFHYNSNNLEAFTSPLTDH